jgi:nucleoside 2-deoxyribosyltransferase
MNIYFAGSIRGGRDDKDLYLAIIDLLRNYGTMLTEHVGDKTLSAQGEQTLTEEFIYERDMSWLNSSDVVVAEVTQPSLGVGYEIAKAEEHKRVLCLYREQEGRRLSAMIAGSKKLRVEKYIALDDVKKIFEDFFKI